MLSSNSGWDTVTWINNSHSVLVSRIPHYVKELNPILGMSTMTSECNCTPFGDQSSLNTVSDNSLEADDSDSDSSANDDSSENIHLKKR